MLSLFLLLATHTAAPTLGLERYEIDAQHSTVGFDGTSSLHDFTGKTHSLGGEIRTDPADPARVAGGVVWVEARTLDTDNSSRDKEMRELLDVDHHPRLVFHLDAVHGSLTDGKGEFKAEGRFTIKGVEKPRVIAFHLEPLPVRTEGGPRELHVLGEVRFPMTEHGIERPGVLFMKVADEVRVWLDLRLRPVADAGVDALVRRIDVEETFTPASASAQGWTKSGQEHLWRAGPLRLWERRLEPCWIVDGLHGPGRIEVGAGSSTEPADWMLEALANGARSTGDGSTWSRTVHVAGGELALKLTFASEEPARLPGWALDPTTWITEPTPAR